MPLHNQAETIQQNYDNFLSIVAIICIFSYDAVKGHAF